MGKCGAGKTTTINRLFGMDWITNPAVECTKVLQAAWIMNDAQKFGEDYQAVMVMDTPGIAAALENDEFYMPYYYHSLSMADCIVWVSQGNMRADRQDQEMLLRLKPYILRNTKIIVCINHIDKIGSDYKKNWNQRTNLPSELMMQYIQQRCADLKTKFDEIGFPLDLGQFIPCSMLKGYGVDELLKAIFDMETVALEVG